MSRLGVDERLAFLEKHFKVDGSRPFERRPWFKDELYTPFSGFRLVARDITRLCGACKERAGSIVERWDLAVEDELDEHASTEDDECGGLRMVPIVFCAITVPRQRGKTTAVMGLILSTALSEYGQELLYTSANEDQAEAIIEKKLKTPIRASPVLAERITFVGSEIRAKQTGSWLRVLNSSFRGGTGLSFGFLFVDEARDVHPRTLAAMTPTMLERGGETCPRHPKVKLAFRADRVRQVCPICGDRTIPWWPRAVLFSSLGILEGTERDWFPELVAVLQEQPELLRFWHCFAADAEGLFAATNQETQQALEVFLRVKTLAPYFEAELTNRARRMGETFVRVDEIDRVTDRGAFADSTGSEVPAVSWLDASKTKELTSWVVCEDAQIEGQKPWETIRVVRIDSWLPEALPGGVVDPTKVQAIWDEFMPEFLGMRVTMVDTRGMEWAKDFAIFNQAKRPVWGRRVAVLHRKSSENGEKQGARYRDLSGSLEERRKAYQELERRIAYQKIILPGGKYGDKIKQELLGAVRVRHDEVEDIRDKNRKRSHLDIVDAIAGCCLLAYREAQVKTQKTLADLRPSALERLIGPMAGYTRGLSTDVF